MRRSVYGAVLLACCSAIACGDEESAEPMGRGTDACRDFQDATCDFASDRCGAVDRGTCDVTFRGVECLSDKSASACANALNTAACGVQSPECSLDAIIDRDPANAKCMTLTEAICQHNATCGGQTLSACMEAAFDMGVDCSLALSIDLRYEACLDAVASLACGSPTPDVCREVVLVLPPGVNLS